MRPFKDSNPVVFIIHEVAYVALPVPNFDSKLDNNGGVDGL